MRQLVVDLIKRLLEQEDREQLVALCRVGGDEERVIERPEVAAQEGGRRPCLPDFGPRGEVVEGVRPGRGVCEQPGVCGVRSI